MKNLLFFALSLALAVPMFAQKALTEGSIKLELTEVKADDPQMESMLAGMRGSTNETYFSKDKQKNVTSMLGGLVSIVIFSDEKESRTYSDMMGQKVMVRTKNETVKKDDKMDIDFVYTKETKTIQGYKCEKVLVKPKNPQSGADTPEMELVLYVTKDIKVRNTVNQQFDMSKLEGTPLEMSISTSGMTMVYTCKSVDSKLPKDVFNEPKGFKEVTQEEFEKMTRSGMGF